MASQKSSFLDKVLGRIDRLDKEGLQTVVQRLARERSFLEMLFNTIEDGVLVADAEGKVMYLNQAVTRLLGLQAQAVEGERLSHLAPELDYDKLAATSRGGGQRIIRHEIEVSYPRPRFLSVYAAPLEGDKLGNAGLALIIHDATEAREKTFAAIESERVQALTLLAASVAHEIGNPLNALHIHLQLMERELRKLRNTATALGTPTLRRSSRKATLPTQPADELREALLKLDKFLDVSKGEITRLDYIVTQFLQAIRPAPPQLRLASLNEAVQETLAVLRPEIENRGLSVQEKLARQMPPSPMDPSQIKQVLVNLCKNALQAMTSGGVLTLRTDRGPDGVWVSVSDTGGGIPDEQINRLFQPFFTTKKKGTGLGLMIVQRIVREHGGRIEVESRVGKGTTFRVWLPLQERPQRLLAAGDAQAKAASPPSPSPDPETAPVPQVPT